MPSPDASRIKCGYCYAEWPVIWTTRRGRRRSGWRALANHLEDRQDEGGHPILTVEQLVCIQRGVAPLPDRD